MPTRRHTLAVLGLAGASAAGLAACDKKPNFVDGGSKIPPKAIAAISFPSADATNVPAGVEIVYTVGNAVSSKFEVKDANGAAVAGDLHPDKKGWIPAKMLDYGAVYSATLAATGDDNKTVTVTNKFTVMAKPTNQVRFTSFLPDNKEIGTGMPLIFQMNRDIPKDARAQIQRRLMVRTDPFVDGVWAWYTPRELHWRPRDFWKPGVKVFVDARVGGIDCGAGFYGVRNVTLTCTTTRQLIMTCDDHSVPKVMVVTVDGAEQRRIPVSLGKPEWQSSSGVMVIIEKKDHTIFDTRNDPNAREKYVAEVDWAQRITWAGEHIHAAPWSVQHQGIRDVSHGCVNMSTENAKWLYDLTLIGDPVITSNTGATLKYGDGWTHWTIPFEEYAKGSAIPYAPPPDPSATPSPSPSN
jgi:lipoprotein-anchoring transpeptidase ErfK/SrfK